MTCAQSWEDFNDQQYLIYTDSCLKSLLWVSFQLHACYIHAYNYVFVMDSCMFAVHGKLAALASSANYPCSD